MKITSEYFENLSARITAEYRLKELEKQWAAEKFIPHPMLDWSIARYKSQEDLFALTPENFDLPFCDHEDEVQAFAEAIYKKHQIKLKVITITANDFRIWRLENKIGVESINWFSCRREYLELRQNHPYDFV